MIVLTQIDMILFLLSVSFLVLISGAPNDFPEEKNPIEGEAGGADPCVGYKVEKTETRSARHKTDIDNDSILCDTNIDENVWYRFEVLTPYRLHDRCVTELKCGTERPIWVNGSHPTAQNPGPKNLDVCSYDMNTKDCCGGWKATISSKYCIATSKDDEDFFVYRLKKPPNCHMAYCAGDAKVCKKGTSNPNSNTCTTSCPNITRAEFEGPVSVNKTTKFGQPYEDFFFACNIKWSNPDTLSKGEQFQVVFTFDGQEVESVAPKITDGSNLNVRLWSKELLGQMGKRVGCKVLPYWKGVKKSNCKYLEAKTTYFVGFNYSTDNTEGSFTNPPIVTDENSPPLTLYFKPTVPISCPESDKQTNCLYSITVADIPKDDRLGVLNCNMNFIGLQSGKKFKTLTIKAVKTPGVKQRSSVIRFNPINAPKEFFWNNYTLPEIPVTIKDSSIQAWCWTGGDPHISTFDKKYYNSYVEGDFILAKSTSRNFEVHVRQHKCWTVSCNCGVAVREGNNVMGVNACQGTNYSPTPITYLKDPKVPGATITRSGNEYKITMPSGAYVTINMCSFKLSNIVVYVNTEDFSKTSGLCGNYNDDIADDGSPEANINKYRLKPEESFLNGHIYPIKCLATETQPNFCSCEGSRPVACESRDIDPCTVTDTFDTKFTHNCGEDVNQRRRKKQLETVTQNNTNTERRVTRKLIITEDDIPLPEVDENHGVNVTLRWPTASGITEVEAKRKCQAKMESSPVYQLCKDRITSNMEAIIVNCVADLQITDDVNVATSGIISDFQAVCVHKVENSVVSNGSSIPTQEEILLANVVSLICPSQCNGNGNCRNGTCVCNDGFAGEDCSINAAEPPRLSSFRKGPLCDFRTSVCSETSIFATNFYRSQNLTCKVTAVGDARQFNYNGSVLSNGEVICPFPDVNSLIDPKAINNIEQAMEIGPAPVYRWDVTLTNDGSLFSNSIRLIVFDSKCQECHPDGTCAQKPETCVIDGRCFLSDSAAGDCEVCNSSKGFNKGLLGYGDFDRIASSLRELVSCWDEFKKEVMSKLVPQ